MSEVAVRDAATVMVVRDGRDGPEVLLVRRTSAAVFAAGAHVFPGGVVDDVDHEPETAARLGIDAAAEPAFRVAAVREAFEEAGVLLVGDAAESLDADRLDALRRALLSGTSTLSDVLDGAGADPAAGELRFVGRWVTPPGGPRRYDTRFFLAPAPAGQEPCHDDAETVACEWFRPGDAIAAAERGELELILPTLRSLELVDRFDSLGALLAALDAADADDPVVESPFGWRVRLPGELDGAGEGVA